MKSIVKSRAKMTTACMQVEKLRDGPIRGKPLLRSEPQPSQNMNLPRGKHWPIQRLLTFGNQDYQSSNLAHSHHLFFKFTEPQPRDSPSAPPRLILTLSSNSTSTISTLLLVIIRLRRWKELSSVYTDTVSSLSRLRLCLASWPVEDGTFSLMLLTLTQIAMPGMLSVKLQKPEMRLAENLVNPARAFAS